MEQIYFDAKSCSEITVLKEQFQKIQHIFKKTLDWWSKGLMVRGVLGMQLWNQ